MLELSSDKINEILMNKTIAELISDCSPIDSSCTFYRNGNIATIDVKNDMYSLYIQLKDPDGPKETLRKFPEDVQICNKECPLKI